MVVTGCSEKAAPMAPGEPSGDKGLGGIWFPSGNDYLAGTSPGPMPGM